jgi:palmitoyl transferase
MLLRALRSGGLCAVLAIAPVAGALGADAPAASTAATTPAAIPEPAPDDPKPAAAAPKPDAATQESAWIPCGKMWSWLDYQCSNLKKAWHEGTPDIYVTGITYHDRGTYTAEKIATYNEASYGGGLGWSRRADNGDDFGWYGVIYRDSHYNYTKMFGWTWMTYWPEQRDYAVGLGYTIFLGSRPDIYNNVPFPGILPLASVKLRNLEIVGTYIPKVSQGTTGNGNVAFVFLRYHL